MSCIHGNEACDLCAFEQAEADNARLRKQLGAAKALIAAFDMLLVGCKEKTWAGWQNGNGRDVGKIIEAKRRKYNRVMGNDNG